MFWKQIQHENKKQKEEDCECLVIKKQFSSKHLSFMPIYMAYYIIVLILCQFLGFS